MLSNNQSYIVFIIALMIFNLSGAKPKQSGFVLGSTGEFKPKSN
jgi:hypothetical protein